MKDSKFSNTTKRHLSNRYDHFSNFINNENPKHNKTFSRYAIALLLSITVSPLLITGCDS